MERQGTTASGAARGRRQPRNLQEAVLHDLGRAVVAGEIPPGGSLPTEQELAVDFGVSKTVIREAMKGLAAKGLVLVRPKIGTRVLPRESWQVLDPDVLAWQLDAPPDGLLLRDLEEFRLAVEPVAARLAATRASDDDRRALADALARMKATVDDPDRHLQADVDFHAALLEAAHNRMLTGLREAVRSALLVRHRHVGRHVVDMAESLPLHDAICAAVFGGDGEGAAAASVELLEQVQRDDDEVMARRGGPHDDADRPF